MAARYWVGGTATWDATAGTKWALTSGGAGGQAVPTTSDDVFFDAASGAVTVTINHGTGVSALTLDCTGFTGTWSHTGNVTGTVAGNLFKLVPGMAYVPSAASRSWTFTSTSGPCLITTAGKTLGNFIFNGVGGTWQIQDNLTLRSDSSFTLTNGTFDGNGFNVSVGSLSSSNNNTRTLTLGNGSWELKGSGSTILQISGSNLTFNKGTSSLNITTATGIKQLLSTVTWNDINISAQSGSGIVQTTSALSGAALNLTVPFALMLTGTNTFTSITGITGTSTNQNYISSGSAGTQGTLSIASVSPVFEWTAFKDVIFAGAGSTWTANNSFNLRNNSNITINAPSGGSVTGTTRARVFTGF